MSAQKTTYGTLSVDFGQKKAFLPEYENKREKTNHLGNVLAVVSDRKIAVEDGSTGIIDYYEADLVSAQDYYPFGMLQPGRSVSAGEYRYGFNSMEQDDEWSVISGHLNFGARIYDARLCRWLALDPAADEYPSLSDYSGFANNPLIFTDPDGKRIRPMSPETERILNLHLESFGDNHRKVFDLETYSVFYMSRDANYPISRERRNALSDRASDAGWGRSARRSAARSGTYLALTNSDIVEVAIMQAGTPPRHTTIGEGSDGSGGTARRDEGPAHNRTPGLDNLWDAIDNEGGGVMTEQIRRDLFNPEEGNDRFTPDVRGDGYVFWRGRGNIEGTLYIDGTGLDDDEKAALMDRAFREILSDDD